MEALMYRDDLNRPLVGRILEDEGPLLTVQLRDSRRGEWDPCIPAFRDQRGTIWVSDPEVTPHPPHWRCRRCDRGNYGTRTHCKHCKHPRLAIIHH